MKEKSRCSTLFHLLVHGGKWQTARGRRSSSERRGSSHFPKRSREPLLPPASAVISNLLALGYARRPSARHHARIEATAKVAVSWSVPILTKPLFRVSS